MSYLPVEKETTQDNDKITCYELINNIMSLSTDGYNLSRYSTEYHRQNNNLIKSNFKSLNNSLVFTRGYQGKLTFDFHNLRIVSEVEKEYGGTVIEIDILRKKAVQKNKLFGTSKDITNRFFNDSFDFNLGYIKNLWNTYIQSFKRAGCDVIDNYQKEIEFYKTTFVKNEFVVDALKDNFKVLEVDKSKFTIFNHPRVIELENYMDIYNVGGEGEYILVLWSDRLYDNLDNIVYEQLSVSPDYLQRVFLDVYLEFYNINIYVVDASKNVILKSGSDCGSDYSCRKITPINLHIFKNEGNQLKYIGMFNDLRNISEFLSIYAIYNTKYPIDLLTNFDYSFYLKYDISRARMYGLR